MTNLNVQTELNFKEVTAKVSVFEIRKETNFLLQKDVFIWTIQTEVSGDRKDLICQRQSEDFQALRQILSQIYPYIMVPRLPSKLDYKEDKVDELQKYLQKFLTAVLQSEVLKSCKLVSHFLKLDGKQWLSERAKFEKTKFSGRIADVTSLDGKVNV